MTEGIRVLPGGHVLKFDTGHSKPVQRTYFQRAELAHLSHQADNRPDIAYLAASLRRDCSAF